jgi:hypothetical protein
MAKIFEIRADRLNNTTEKSYSFLESSYSKNRIFLFIPFSQIIKNEKFEKVLSQTNPNTVTWFRFTVKDWIWEKGEFEEKLSYFGDSKALIIKK